MNVSNSNENSIMVNISIIVPVYNVEKYLTRCLDSIYNQKFSGTFEVITVEDCSTDKSLEILKNYQNNEPRLIVVQHKTNKKLAQARTSGMQIANGDYIMHVDSDDRLLPNALQNIFDKCNESNADVLVFDYIIENEKGEQTKNNYLTKEIITSNKNIVQQYFYGACWNKIVKKSLVNNLVYSLVEAPRSTEDLIYCSEILLRANVICLFPEKFYAYFINSSSITQSSTPLKYLSNQTVISKKISQIFIKYNPTEKFRDSLLDYFSKYLFLSIAKIHFYNKSDLLYCKTLLHDINKGNLIDKHRIIKINRAINNKYYSLYQVSKGFDIKLPLGIFYRYLKNKNK